MIGVNFVYESHQLMYSQKVELESIDQYTPDYFDFDSNSINDFKDYISFLDYSEYVFVTLNEDERTLRLCNYLKQTTNFLFSVISYDNFLKDLSTDTKKELNKQIKRNKNVQQLKKNNFKNVLENGYHSYFMNMYPNIFRKGLIKHLFVNNLEEDIDKIDSSIIDAMGINSELIFETSDFNDYGKLPVVVNDQKYLNKPFKKSILIDADLLRKYLETFISHGTVSETNSLIQDYGCETGLSRMNCLTLSHGFYFKDSNKSIRIGDIESTYSQLLNTYFANDIESKFTKFNPALISLFPFLVEVNAAYGPNLKFITPYNKLKLDPVDNFTTDTDWIAFGNDVTNSYHVYSLLKQKLFEVNKPLFDAFEYVVKGRVDGENKNATKLEEMLINA